VSPTLLELRDVQFAYGSSGGRMARPFAMPSLSLSVEPGEILGVIGPNSAGKTTLIRLVTRVLTPLAGEICLHGRPLTGVSAWELARTVAVVPQEVPPALRFTVEQLVLMGRYPHAPARFFESGEDLAIARAAMAATGVLELAALPVEILSGGERQRTMLARALAQEPDLLVLDEPTAHLDLRYQVECAALLERLNRERGTSILLVSHDLNLAAQLCDRLLLLAEGRIVRLGPPAEVLDEGLLRTVYGCDVAVEVSTSGRRQVQVTWPERKCEPQDVAGLGFPPSEAS
jgi:ABC-type cobalamin/Fe3+-siderophores transport system ATPase subunit